MKSLVQVFLVLALATQAFAEINPAKESVMSRFLRYVRIDTQSAEDQTTVPSTPKQRKFASLLADELRQLGADDVRVSEFSIVYARVRGNLGNTSDAPVLGLIAHIDTSPEVSGANVRPIVHTNYQGGEIRLPGDPNQVITPAANPDLAKMIGDDIITADGTSLLGSDDKAGCAAIMTLLDLLRANPTIPHGTLAIAFTPDEEVGAGIEKFDTKGFGAKYAYTVDGEALGEISDETWNAKTATVTFKGKNTHPGTSKGIMVNSMFAAADFLARCPTDMLPETTEKRVGFIHPYTGKLEVDESSVKVLLRDFDRSGLDVKEKLVRDLAAKTQTKFPRVRIEVAMRDEYKNMREVLKNYPELVGHAMEAARKAGLTPQLKPVRGGTDGSWLTFHGLPCPDLFTGGHNFHGKLEFNSRRGLEKTTETLLHLVQEFTKEK